MAEKTRRVTPTPFSRYVAVRSSCVFVVLCGEEEKNDASFFSLVVYGRTKSVKGHGLTFDVITEPIEDEIIHGDRNFQEGVLYRPTPFNFLPPSYSAS